LDSDQAIENAINYVIENPIKEGKPKQNWKWITPYDGSTQAGRHSTNQVEQSAAGVQAFKAGSESSTPAADC